MDWTFPGNRLSIVWSDFAYPDEMKVQCLQACREVAALLSQKAPADAEAYKQWVYQSAQNSANAASEGGFFGIGGERVTAAETAALKEIATALGIPSLSGM